MAEKKVLMEHKTLTKKAEDGKTVPLTGTVSPGAVDAWKRKGWQVATKKTAAELDEHGALPPGGGEADTRTTVNSGTGNTGGAAKGPNR